MDSLKQQKGISLLSISLFTFLILFFGLLVVKMSRSYYDYFTLNRTIELALEEQTPVRFSEIDFMERFEKNLQINRIQLDVQRILTVNKRKTPILITLDYEKRVTLFWNVDVVMKFYQEYEI